MKKTCRFMLACSLALLLQFIPVLTCCFPATQGSFLSDAGAARAATYYETLDVGDTAYLYTKATGKAVLSAFWTTSDSSCVQILSQDSVSCRIEVTDYTSSRVVVQCEYYYQELVGGYMYTFSGYTDYYITIRDTRVVVTLNPQGGSVSPSSVTFLPGDAYGYLPEPTRTGYRFMHWEMPNGSTVSSYSSLYSTSSHTLYARWKPITYSISFNGNGADSGSMEEIDCIYDASVALPANAFTRAGYTFSGWSRYADGSGTIYADAASVRNLSSSNFATVNLYAVWSSTSTDVSKYRFTLTKDSYTYDGTEKKPSVLLKNGALQLTEGTDYTVTYQNNVNAGTATVIVTGIGQYTGSARKTFTINRIPATATLSHSAILTGQTAQITLSSTAGATYSGYDSSLVSISSSGLITGLQEGSTTITVTTNTDVNHSATTIQLSITIAPNNTGSCGDNLTWYYDLDTQELTISGTGPMNNYNYRTAPWYSFADSIRTLTLEEGVTRIGTAAFFGLDEIRSVVIPDSVKEINNYAFDCEKLSSITLGNGLERIGRYAFDGSAYYNNTSTYPNNCLILGNWIIAVDYNVTVKIPANIVGVADGLFEFMYKVSVMSGNEKFVSDLNATFTSDYTTLLHARNGYYMLPDTLKVIYPSAFSGLSNKTITLPNSVEVIGNSAFYACESLTYMVIPEGVKRIESSTFAVCSKLRTVTLPASVQYIGPSAFAWCSSLTSIKLPDGIPYISNYTFERCTALSTITIPDSVTQIGAYAFYVCKSLQSMKLPEGLTLIGDNAFTTCSSMASINLPDSITTIGKYAFSSCRALKTITLPKGITVLKDGTFAYCEALSTITIPANVESIGTDCFKNCPALNTVYFGGNEVQKRLLLLTAANNGNQDLLDATWICAGSDVTLDMFSSVAILPDGLKVIEAEAFLGVDAEAVIIPAGCTEIRSRAFANCPNLVYVVLPDSVTTVADDAFDGCPDILFAPSLGS